jgi:hypothetical protein
MPVAVMAVVMADIAVTGVAMLSEDMLPAISRVDTLVSVLVVDVGTMWHGRRAAMRAMRVAHMIGMAAVTGVVVIGIRPMDILDWAITAQAMAIHTTGLAIMVTATVGTMGRTTDTTLTATDIGGRP